MNGHRWSLKNINNAYEYAPGPLTIKAWNEFDEVVARHPFDVQGGQLRFRELMRVDEASRDMEVRPDDDVGYFEITLENVGDVGLSVYSMHTDTFEDIPLT